MNKKHCEFMLTSVDDWTAKRVIIASNGYNNRFAMVHSHLAVVKAKAKLFCDVYNQYFPERVPNPKGGHQHSIRPKARENGMKIKTIGPGGDVQNLSL